MNEHCYDGMYIVQLYTARLGSAQQSTTKKWNDEKVHWCDMNEFLIAYYEFYAHSHYLWHLLCVCLLDFLAMIPFSLWLRPNSHCHNDNNFSKIVFTAWSGTLKTHNTHSQSFALSHTHTYIPTLEHNRDDTTRVLVSHRKGTSWRNTKYKQLIMVPCYQGNQNMQTTCSERFSFNIIQRQTWF